MHAQLFLLPAAYSKAFLSCALLSFSTIGCSDAVEETKGRDPRVPLTLGEPAQPNPQNRPNDSSPAVPQPANPVSSDPTANTPSDTNGNAGTNIPPSGGDSAQPKPDTPAPPSTAPRRPTLTVAISGLQNTDGNFCMSIFNSPDGFPDSAEKAILAECFTVTERSFSIEIQNFPAGRFAIAGWHDENKDKKLNYNFLGIPKEGMSFSENGKPRLTPPPGPPTFEAISFVVGDENRTTQMKTTYLLDLL